MYISFRFIIQFLLCTVLLTLQKAEAEPKVSVSSSYVQEQVSVSISGSDIPEMKCMTFTCSYDTNFITIMDAIISSALPSTAISVAVNSDNLELTIVIQAASTVLVTDGIPLITLRLPVAQEHKDAQVLTLTKVIVMDKKGVDQEATINTTDVVRRCTPQSSPFPPEWNHYRSRIYMLNGQAMKTGRRTVAAGYILTLGRHTNMRGNIVIQ